MRVNQRTREKPGWLTAAVWLALAVLGLLHFYGVGKKWMALLAGVGVIVLLVRGDRKRLWNAPSLLLLGYAAWSWLTVFWAMSGKFHLREGSKILIAVFFFLLVALHKRMDGAFARRVMGMIAALSALFALMSVEAASSGFCKALLERLGTGMGAMVFQNSRLSGIFGNSNMESSVYAVGIFCAVALACGTEKRWHKAFWTAALSLNAFAFLLVFSMGAMTCFAAAVVVYLIFAGRGRSAALLRMLSAAVPTLGCGFLAFSLFSGDRAAAVSLVMLANAGISVLLELTVSERLSVVLERHERLAFCVLAAVVLAAGVYAAAALHVTGAYTFGPEIYRSERLGAGEHTVRVEADGTVSLRVYTQSIIEMMGNSATILYEAPAEGEIAFTVPEGDVMTFFVLSADSGVTVQSVRVDGTIELPLHYVLLPGFAANRVQSLGMSSSVTLRRLYRQDAVRLWRLSPMIGNGVGAFETGISSVQDYPYETKYVHNHYLQILLEDGVIGLALYAGALLALLLALWKKRKQAAESEYAWLYPALLAEFVMNGAQMCWDVSMSMIIFLCVTYALYGLTVGAFAEPFREKAAAEESGAKKKAPAGKRDLSLYVRNTGIGFTAVVVLTLVGNLIAAAVVNAPADSSDVFLQHLSTAAKLDLYERNDDKLSYIVGSLEVGDGCRAQADRYAAELSRVQSNVIPFYLVNYYLRTQQYGEAVDEAIRGAAYSASDRETWQNCSALLDQALFADAAGSPLLTQRDELMPKLTAYRQALESYNASAILPVELDESAQAFFDEIAALEACGNDETQFLAVLTERAQG